MSSHNNNPEASRMNFRSDDPFGEQFTQEEQHQQNQLRVREQRQRFLEKNSASSLAAPYGSARRMTSRLNSSLNTDRDQNNNNNQQQNQLGSTGTFVRLSNNNNNNQDESMNMTYPQNQNNNNSSATRTTNNTARSLSHQDPLNLDQQHHNDVFQDTARSGFDGGSSYIFNSNSYQNTSRTTNGQVDNNNNNQFGSPSVRGASISNILPPHISTTRSTTTTTATSRSVSYQNQQQNNNSNNNNSPPTSLGMTTSYQNNKMISPSPPAPVSPPTLSTVSSIKDIVSINIIGAEKIKDAVTKKEVVFYTICTSTVNSVSSGSTSDDINNKPWSMLRRFSEFDALHDKLEKMLKTSGSSDSLNLPEGVFAAFEANCDLPSKFSFSLSQSDEFVSKRKGQVEKYLQNVLTFLKWLSGPESKINHNSNAVSSGKFLLLQRFVAFLGGPNMGTSAKKTSRAASSSNIINNNNHLKINNGEEQEDDDDDDFVMIGGQGTKRKFTSYVAVDRQNDDDNDDGDDKNRNESSGNYYYSQQQDSKKSLSPGARFPNTPNSILLGSSQNIGSQNNNNTNNSALMTSPMGKLAIARNGSLESFSGTSYIGGAGGARGNQQHGMISSSLFSTFLPPYQVWHNPGQTFACVIAFHSCIIQIHTRIDAKSFDGRDVIVYGQSVLKESSQMKETLILKKSTNNTPSANGSRSGSASASRKMSSSVIIAKKDKNNTTMMTTTSTRKKQTTIIENENEDEVEVAEPPERTNIREDLLTPRSFQAREYLAAALGDDEDDNSSIDEHGVMKKSVISHSEFLLPGNTLVSDHTQNYLLNGLEFQRENPDEENNNNNNTGGNDDNQVNTNDIVFSFVVEVPPPFEPSYCFVKASPAGVTIIEWPRPKFL